MRIREQATRPIEESPEDMIRDDLMYEIYVRQSIEAGLADSEAGRVTAVAEVRLKFGLDL